VEESLWLLVALLFRPGAPKEERPKSFPPDLGCSYVHGYSLLPACPHSAVTVSVPLPGSARLFGGKIPAEVSVNDFILVA